MYKMQRAQLEEITPGKAANYLLMNNYHNQRTINKRHVDFLADKMLHGEFRTGLIGFAEMVERGRKVTYLVNGQHQLSAVVQVGTPIRATTEIFTCETHEDLSALFRNFDNHKTRTMSQMLKVEMDALGLEWHYRSGTLLVGALNFLASNKNRYAEERVMDVAGHISEGEFIDRILSGSEHAKYLRRRGVAAAMVLTWRACPSDARAFWTDVRDGERLTRDMPQAKLREYVISTYGQKRRLIKDKEIVVRCIHAWNAYRKGSTTLLRYYDDCPIPKAA